MHSTERLFVSAATVSLPAVVVAQVAAALLSAAAGHRGESSAIGVAIFTLLVVASQAWSCRLVRNREHAGRKLALVAVLLTAIAWAGIASASDHPVARLFQTPVVVSAAVLLAVSLGISSAMPRLAAKLPRELDGAFSRRRGLSIVWALCTLAAVAQGARLSVSVET